MSLSRYPKYKDSGVDWLGEMPEHWIVDRFKTVLAIKKNVVGDSASDYVLLSLTLQGVIPRDLDNPFGKFPADFDSYQAVQKMDLIFCLFDVEETPRAVGIAEQDGMVTGAYTIASVKASNFPRYFFYFYLSRDQYKAFKMYYTGLRNVIRKETFLSIPCPIPPSFEQQLIADFLDRETEKIDALVAEQEKLIGLLKEKRQAIISHAVTKGLNPNAKMKDSGIEWLGEMPGHWVRKPLKHCCSLLKDGTHLPPPRVEEGIPLLSVRNISGNEFGLLADDSLISEADYMNLCRSFIPYVGDVLLAIVGGTIGKTAVITGGLGKFHIQRSLAIFRPTESLTSLWLYYLFQSNQFQQLLWEHVGYSAQPGIYLGTLANFRIPLPPLNDQLSAISFLNKEVARLDALIAEAERAIELLHERRSALISAAVTGKIDVRNLSNAKEAA